MLVHRSRNTPIAPFLAAFRWHQRNDQKPWYCVCRLPLHWLRYIYNIIEYTCQAMHHFFGERNGARINPNLCTMGSLTTETLLRAGESLYNGNPACSAARHGSRICKDGGSDNSHVSTAGCEKISTDPGMRFWFGSW